MKKGDIVRIVRPGSTYSRYTDIFIKLNFNDTVDNPSWKMGDVGQIFDICEHPDRPIKLYALVDKDGRECLIGEDGIELLKFERIPPPVLFHFQINEFNATISKNKFIVGCQTITKETWKLICEKVKESGFDTN